MKLADVTARVPTTPLVWRKQDNVTVEMASPGSCVTNVKPTTGGSTSKVAPVGTCV